MNVFKSEKIGGKLKSNNRLLKLLKINFPIRIRKSLIIHPPGNHFSAMFLQLTPFSKKCEFKAAAAINSSRVGALHLHAL
jgi:hypothetical protein